MPFRVRLNTTCSMRKLTALPTCPIQRRFYRWRDKFGHVMKVCLSPRLQSSNPPLNAIYMFCVVVVFINL